MSVSSSASTGSRRRPRVAIVNRLYPPRLGITGESACELAAYLQNQAGCEVHVVTTAGQYGGGGTAMAPVGQVHMIPTWYDGKQKLKRLPSSYFDSYRLIRTARDLRCDHVIVMTDPTFLTYFAASQLGNRIPWTLWAMDLYPDAFVASGLVSRWNPLFQLCERRVNRNPPRNLIALGPLQAKYLEQKYGRPIPHAVLPCGVYDGTIQSTPPAWRTASDRVLLGYCGNLGEAHSTEFLRSVIEQLDPQRHQLILSVYGSKAAEIQAFAANRPGIVHLPSVSRADLAHIDVHLVSLLGHWSHICVPSKAVSAVCAGGSFLFCGPAECDNWYLLQDAGWLIDESQSIPQQVARFLATLDINAVAAKRLAARELAAKLLAEQQMAFSRIAELVSQ